MDEHRVSFAAAVFQERLYAIGGGQWSLATVEYLDKAASSWKSGPSLTSGRMGHSAAVFQDKLYIAGGDFPYSSHCFDTVEYLEKSATSWKSASRMKEFRAYLGM